LGVQVAFASTAPTRRKLKASTSRQKPVTQNQIKYLV